MPSFDIVSEINMQEVDNAVNQSRKELAGRYDFRGSKAEIIWDKKEIQLVADDETKLAALKDIVQGKLHHRGVDITSLKIDKPEAMGGMMQKQKISLVQGIDKEKAKDIMKAIKESKLKATAQIQDEKVKVTSKSIDTLQECISLLKSQRFGLPLQFMNMRS